jgi:DNA-binding PadR family transcriptional regulator
MPKKPNGARSNPGHVRTGISRAILSTLSREPLSIDEILSKLGPRSGSVTHGTVWTTLDRQRGLGLVQREQRGRTYFYSLTEGGQRRVAWIRGSSKSAVRRPRAVANPPEKEGEE